MFLPSPKVIEIDGIKTPVDPDFRIMCEYSAASRRRDSGKLRDIAARFYFAGLPEGVSEKQAGGAIMDFYINGLAPKYDPSKENAGKKTPPPSFDFEEDEAYFYAAFLSEYGIDLYTAKLHWYDFCALFRGLPDECRLKRIISVRATELSEIKSKSEKARIKKLKGIYALRSSAHKRYKNAAERDAAMRADIKRRQEEVRRMAEKGGS